MDPMFEPPPPNAPALAIVGSRMLEGHPRLNATIRDVLLTYRPRKVISGGARGVDRAAAEIAEARGIPTQVFRPWPKAQGRQAFAIAASERNQQIVDAADLVVAIIGDGKSNGTRDTLRRAARSGVPTQTIRLARVEAAA